jgi:CP family cyanate transporter-like MFS transporter
MIKGSKVKVLAFLGILFIGLNLRSPFTSVAPVLGQIMEGLSLSPSAAGILTALPLFSFAIFSPISPQISRKFGLYPTLTFALFLIASGIMFRSLGYPLSLYAGTVMIGAGIAIGNVLLPVVVKISFPTKIAVITSLYVFMMGIASTFTSSLMVPISGFKIYEVTGWQLALLFNLLLPIAALLVWLPQRKKATSAISGSLTEQNTDLMAKLLRCPVAWYVTLGVGLNSFIFYSFAGWLPTILNDFGFDEVNAGYTYGFLQFATTVPGLLLVPILSRTTNQRLLVTIVSSSGLLALFGIMVLPQYAVLWVGVFGVANCSTFIIGISFIGQRTDNQFQAAALSGMSQSIGYGLAATGPSIIGYLHSVTDSWTASLLVISFVASMSTLFINLAARERKVFDSLNR